MNGPKTGGPTFSAEGIWKRFGSKQVLKSASLWAERGKVTALLGRNGSGKSTLLAIAAGALKADAGSIRYDGVRVERSNHAALSRLGLLYLPQIPAFSPLFTLREHFEAIEAARRGYPDGRSAAPDLAEVAARLRLGPWLDHPFAALSGGEQIRASLALPFLFAPTCLLADELLSGLAPLDGELALSVLRESADAGAAVVVAGHQARTLLDFVDVVLWSVAGTTHHLGTPTDARRHAQFVQEYLGPT